MLPFIKTPKNYVSIRLSGDAAMIYMHMLDIYKLSYQNDWIDDNGIFLYYSIANIEKARLCSRPKAIKILKELEEKGYITKETQKGKPTKIYLVENDYTRLELEGVEKNKKTKKHKKITPKKVAKNDKQEEVINNKMGVVEEIVDAEPEVKIINHYTENQSIFDVFKAIIGREPDNSFKKCMAKRAAQMNLTAENMRGIIELARKARKPEAYILAITKPNQEPQTTYQPAQKAPEPAKEAPLDEYEIEWLLDIEKSKEESNKVRVKELEQMLEVINQKKAEKEAQRPLEQWEIDWLEDMKAYEEKNISNLCDSQNIPLEVQYYPLN